MDTTQIIIIAVAVAVPVAGIVIFMMMRAAARARDQRQWDLAWDQLGDDPGQALEIFRDFITLLKAKPGRETDQIRRTLAHLGSALALIRLHRYEDAAEEEADARDGSDWTPEDDIRICEAWIEEAPKPITTPAVEACARYLTFSARETEPKLERKAEDLLQSTLQVSEFDSAEELQRIVELAQRVIKLLPKRDTAHYALGLALSRLNRWKEAVTPLETSVSAHPELAERQRVLAQAYLVTGDRRKARATYLEAYRLEPLPEPARAAGLLCEETADIAFDARESRAAGSENPLETAAALLTQTTRASDADGEAWSALGRSLARLNRAAEAVAALEKAVALGIRSKENCLHLGRSHLALGKRDLARQQAAAALQIDPNYREAALLAGDLAFEAGAYGEALEFYRKLGEPDNTPLAERMARSCLECNQPTAAIALLGQREPLSIDGRLVLGRAHARTGAWLDALTVLQAVDPAATSPAYRYYLANALAANGQYDAADVYFTELESNPQWSPRVQRYRGHVKLLRGDNAGAEESYRASNHPSMPLDLGRLSLVRQDPEAAKEQFEQMLTALPTSKSARLGRALAVSQLGDNEPLVELSKDPVMAPFASEPLADQAYEDRNYVAALDSYQRAIAGRRRIPSRILSRMAVGCLHLARYPAAYPHLVELSRRHPDLPSVRWNLALCRYHIGREHFRNKRWDSARGEFSRCHHLLQPIAPVEAESIRHWEAESAYRAATEMMLAEPPAELERAAQIFEEGTKSHPQHARWWLGAGLAAALASKFVHSASCFAEAARLEPNRPEFVLGEGLSYHLDNRNAEAEPVLRRVTGLVSDGTKPQISIAARVALAAVYAAEKQWIKAAEELLPLLDDPVIQSSKRYSTTDMAQSIVAYFALGGDRQRAAEVARARLPDASVGDLLLGLMQAESGDYPGAAETLARTLQQDDRPAIRKLLVACLLNAAAECIQKKNLKGAGGYIRKALDADPSDRDAKRLDGALEFGRQMKNLDPRKLDEAIRECEDLVDRRDAASQLIRTLGVLYHRKALQAEKSGKGSEEAWTLCLNYWRKKIFKSDSFWTSFADEYNAGKGKRELVKPDELTKWREELPGAFAAAHGGMLAEAVKNSDKKGLERHLNLIWDWDPNFEPPKDFLSTEVGKIDDAMAKSLEASLKKVKGEEGRKVINGLLASWWNAKGLKDLDDVGKSNSEAIDKANTAGHINGVSVKLFNETLEEFNRTATSGMRYQMIQSLVNTRAVLEVIVDKMNEAVGLIREAKRLFATAESGLGNARKNFRKARELNPDNKVYGENEKVVDDIKEKIAGNTKDTTEVGDLIDKNLRGIRDNLNQIKGLCRQVGA